MNVFRRVAAAILVVVVIGGVLWFVAFQVRPAISATSLVLYGDIDIREVQPAFNDTGPISEIKVWEGTAIKKGQLIATIDDSRYAATLAQANQQANNLKANLAKLVNGSRPEEIAQAKATMEGLRSIYDNNTILYHRTAELLPHGAASAEDQDNALAQLNSSRNNFEAAQQAYLLAVKGPRSEDISAARAALKAAEAAAALAQKEFDDTKLFAQSDGVVESRILEPGDMASPSTPVLTIALLSPLWVRAYVPEADVGHMRQGMQATISTDSYPGHTYHGWIGYLSPTAEFTPKTVETPELRTALVYQARVYVCDSNGELRLGMPATVKIDLNQASAATTPDCLPSDATRH